MGWTSGFRAISDLPRAISLLYACVHFININRELHGNENQLVSIRPWGTNVHQRDEVIKMLIILLSHRARVSYFIYSSTDTVINIFEDRTHIN